MLNAIRGFTLIELMIVVLIIGVLGAVGIPSYQQYVLRSHRSEGMAALTALAAAQEKWYLQNNSYTTDLADLKLPASTEHGYYDVKIDAADATGFTATIAATGAQIKDEDCANYSINNAGAKTSTNKGGSDSTASCWR